MRMNSSLEIWEKDKVEVSPEEPKDSKDSTDKAKEGIDDQKENRDAMIRDGDKEVKRPGRLRTNEGAPERKEASPMKVIEAIEATEETKTTEMTEMTEITEMIETTEAKEVIEM